jgi:hypothetical protein
MDAVSKLLLPPLAQNGGLGQQNPLGGLSGLPGLEDSLLGTAMQHEQPSSTRADQGGSQRDEVFRLLGRAVILQVIDGKYRAPVVTLQNNEIGTVYSSVIEKHLRNEFLVGSEKFWKLVRADQSLETWRPRVHGTQLKALLNSRLPGE